MKTFLTHSRFEKNLIPVYFIVVQKQDDWDPKVNQYVTRCPYCLLSWSELHSFSIVFSKNWISSGGSGCPKSFKIFLFVSFCNIWKFTLSNEIWILYPRTFLGIDIRLNFVLRNLSKCLSLDPFLLFCESPRWISRPCFWSVKNLHPFTGHRKVVRTATKIVKAKHGERMVLKTKFGGLCLVLQRIFFSRAPLLVVRRFQKSY